jgi:hypothetical protein
LQFLLGFQCSCCSWISVFNVNLRFAIGNDSNWGFSDISEFSLHCLNSI